MRVRKCQQFGCGNKAYRKSRVWGFKRFLRWTYFGIIESKILCEEHWLEATHGLETLTCRYGCGRKAILSMDYLLADEITTVYCPFCKEELGHFEEDGENSWLWAEYLGPPAKGDTNE